MSSAYELKKSCDKHGMKPIFANELYFTPNDPLRKEKIDGFKHSYHILLIAYNNAGYQNLLKLSSDAWTKYRYYKPRVAWEQLQQYSEGIICLSACFLPGQKILVNDFEYKNLEDVVTGDSVVSHTGETRLVNYPTLRNYNGLCKKISFDNSDVVKCTESHEFLCLPRATGNRSNLSYEWRSDLIKGDKVLVPMIKRNISIDIDADLAFIIGAYLAEGHLTKIPKTSIVTGVGFTLHSNEIDYSNRISSAINNLYGFRPSVCIREKNNRRDLVAASRDAANNKNILGNLLLDMCGQYSDKKIVPVQMYKSSDIAIKAMLSGYFYGDGYYRCRHINIVDRSIDSPKYTCHEFTCATVSRSLANGILLLANYIGIKMSLHVSPARTDKDNVNHKESYYLRAYGKNALKCKQLMDFDYASDFIFPDSRKIISINNVEYQVVSVRSVDCFSYSGPVHCLNIETDHSFVLGNVAVKNCLGGYMNQLVMEGKDEDAELAALRFKSIYKENFFLEMQWTGIPEQELTNIWMKGISKKHDIPLVITTDCHYIYKEDTELHRALVTINTGGNFKKIKVDTTGLADSSSEKDTDESSMFYKTGQYYLKPYHVLSEYFSDEQDVVAFANTNKIAEKCNVILPSGLKIFPQLVPDPEKFIMDQCNSFIEEYCADMDADNKKRYTDRLHEESWIIKRMGYFDYFTVVQDMVKYAKDNDILVGLGRGSGASSLICFALGITGIDPLTYNLLFSRFLSSARAPYPLIELEEYPLSKWK